jgi:hypothetical protein
MKRTWKVAVLCAIGMACGGNDNAPPNFNYGAFTTVTNPLSSEATAAGSAQTSLSDALTLKADPSTGAASGTSIIGLPEILAGNLNLYGLSVAPSASLAGNVEASAQVAQGVASALTTPVDPTCYTVTLTNNSASIAYNNCTASIDGVTVTLSGSISASAGELVWDVTATASGTVISSTGVPVSINMTWHATGDLKATDTTLQGWARSDVSATGSAQGQTVSFAYSTQADVDLTLSANPLPPPSFCISSGTLELRRWWTQVPDGASGNPYFANKGVKFVWSGDPGSCWSTLQVAYSQ